MDDHATATVMRMNSHTKAINSTEPADTQHQILALREASAAPIASPVASREFT
jgi:hypothetical protein